MQKFLLFSFLLISGSLTYAQNQITDSLENLLNLERPSINDQLLSNIDRLFEEYHFQGNEPRAKYYAELLIQKAEKLNSDTYQRQGRLNSALTLFTNNKEKSRSIVKELLDEAIIAGDQLIVGQCFYFLGDYNESYISQNSKNYYFNEKSLESFLSINSSKKIYPLIKSVLYNQNQIGLEKSLIQAQKIYSKAKIANHSILMCKSLALILYLQYQLNLFDEASKTADQMVDLSLKHRYYTK